MSLPKKFKIGDHVFAKMKGHPPWPAKIQTIKEKSMGKSFIELYEVQFFGTNEKGTCSKNLIFPYSKELKAKNMIVKTKRYAHLYNEAVKLMEEEIFSGLKEQVSEEPMEVERNAALEEKVECKILEVNESEACNGVDKAKDKNIDKVVDKKKEKVLPKREIIIKLKRIDDVYSDLKTNRTLDLVTKKAVISKSSLVDKLNCPNVYAMINHVVKRLPTPKKKPKNTGKKLYKTTKDSPCIIQNVCTVDEEFFKNSSEATSFVEEKALELFDPKANQKTTNTFDYWAFGDSKSSSPSNPTMKVNAILVKSTNADDPQQFIMMNREHPITNLSPHKAPVAVEHPISGVVSTRGANGIRPKKKRIKITKPRPRTVNKNYNNIKLRKYVPFMKHNDHDYPKIRGKVMMTDDEAEKYFKNFEPIEEDKDEDKTDESDPLDISSVQKEALNKPSVDLKFFGPDVVIKKEPNEPAKKEKEDKEKLNHQDLSQQTFECLKCKRSFSKHSFERHKCGTLKIDNLAGISDINTTLKHVIHQQNWQNRKIVFTCSVCQKLCNNVNELADHLNAVHSQKGKPPTDPLAIDNEVETKKDVKVMVCNVLTPVKEPPVNPKSVIKISSQSNNLVPIAPRIENTAGNPVPLFVQSNQGKPFFLVPENKSKEINNAMPPMPKLTPIPKNNNLPVVQNTEFNGWVMVNGKPMRSVYLNNEDVTMKVNNQPVIQNSKFNNYITANGKPLKRVITNGKLPLKSVNQLENAETDSWVVVNGKPMKTVYLNNGQLAESKTSLNESGSKLSMMQSSDFNHWVMMNGKAVKVANARDKFKEGKGIESDTSGTVTASDDDDEVRVIKTEPSDDDTIANDFKPILLKEYLLSK